MKYMSFLSFFTVVAAVTFAGNAVGDDAAFQPSPCTGIREEFGMIERNIALEARLIDDLFDLTRINHGKDEGNYNVITRSSGETAESPSFVMKIKSPH